MIPNTCNYVFKHNYEINPLHPNISMHILHIVLYTFPKVLMRRIFLYARASLVGDHCLYSHDHNV